MDRPNQPWTPRRLALAAAALAVAALGPGCQHETLRYPHATPEATAQSWADAFNRDERGQLRLLLHPDKRVEFDTQREAVTDKLRKFDIAQWAMGERVVVDGKLEGRELKVFLADGAGTRESTAVLVHAEGDWWVWGY